MTIEQDDLTPNPIERIENPVIELASQNNIFLIDWLTFVAHGETVDYMKWLLGLDGPDIPWETSEKFRNGYPIQTYWNGITISYGADDPRFYKDPTKARKDMGICVNLSGTGCRAFESYGHGDWSKLFNFLLRDTTVAAQNQLHKFIHYNVTRLDLAYDDHIGLLDISRLEQDTRDRYYVSPAKYAEVIWSDDQNDDIQGVTIQIGSDKSDVKVRIYDKAAERGFKDVHWIRCETQLRNDRAFEALKKIAQAGNVGCVAAGILRNYLTYRVPTEDTNRSRWPIADYWDKVLLNMEKVALWKKPGEVYNLSKTEYWMGKQYGQVIVTLAARNELDLFINRCKEEYPVEELSPKYKQYLGPISSENLPQNDEITGGMV